MLNKSIIAVCGFIVLIGSNVSFSDHDRGINMNVSPVAVKLETELLNGDLIAILVFQNTSKHSVFLDKYTACLADELTNNIFNIFGENGMPLQYNGIQIKRKFNKDDFVELKSGTSVRTSVILSDWYQFQKGEHVYSISYNSFNHSYEEQRMFEMTSNKIVVKYDK